MKYTKNKKECCECDGDGQIIVSPAVSSPYLEECTWCDGKGWEQLMKKKEMKFTTMLSTVWCWDCNKPLKKGVLISTKCPCHTKKGKEKL